MVKPVSDGSKYTRSYQQALIDILTDYQARWFQESLLEPFCFECSCLHPQGDLVLCSLHRLTPQALRFLRVEYQKEFLFTVWFWGCLPLPRPLFPVYRFFFPVAVIASFGVRVYVSIVAGGSLTNHIVTQSRPKRTGFLPNFLMSMIDL